jgi:DNA adenine methylase
MIQSIFRYPGGKSRRNVRDWIFSYAPAYREYREPFVGGGGIFFDINRLHNRWINDKDENLIAVYQALKDKPEEFIDKCRSVATYSSGDGEHLKAAFDQIAFNENEDKAFRFFFVNRTVWGGRVNYQYKSRVYFSNPEGWSNNITYRLHTAATYLQDVRITCGDYEVLLSEPGENVWVYCDPPYVKPFKGTSSLYRHDFNHQDHERFAEAVRRSTHKVAVSYEDDPEGTVRSLFKGFDIRETEWTYSGTGTNEKRRGKELLILNYGPQAASNDNYVSPLMKFFTKKKGAAA